MTKYLKLFETDPERVEYEGGEYIEPYVSYVLVYTIGQRLNNNISRAISNGCSFFIPET